MKNMSNNNSLIKKLIFKLIKKHILGSTLNSAVKNIRELNSRGFNTTITFLNDYVTDSSKARYNINTYMQLLRQISKFNLNISVSLRLSQIRYNIDRNLLKGLEEIIELSNKLKVNLWLEAGYNIDINSLIKIYKKYKPKSKYLGIEIPIQFKKIENYFDNTDKVKLSIYKNISNIPIDKDMMQKPAALTKSESKIQKTNQSKKEKPGHMQIAESINTIKKLSNKGLKLTLFIHNLGLATKIFKDIKENEYRKNLIFELPLDNYSKKRFKMIKMNKISIYAPYGKDLIPYAVDRLVDGYIKDIAITILNGRYTKYNKPMNIYEK